MKKPLIAWVMDERLDADATKTVSKLHVSLKQTCDVQTIPGTLSQESVVELMEKTKFQLVVLPWYKYLAWKKVEAFYGLTRTSGPTVAAYCVEAIDPKNIPDLPDYPRFYLFDLMKYTVSENTKLIQALIEPKTRAGIKPFLRSTTPIYFYQWDGKEHTSLMLEGWFELPEFVGPWKDRRHAIATAIGGVRDFVFSTEVSKSGNPFVHFACEPELAIVRIGTLLATAPNNQTIHSFWLKTKSQLAHMSTASRYSDFMRVQWSSSPHQIEITLFFFQSKPSERAQSPHVKATWLEPVSHDLFAQESLLISKSEGVYKALPEITFLNMGDARTAGVGENKIQTLQKQLLERDQLIRDLKSGGVSQPMKSGLPDLEDLAEAVKERLKLHPEKRDWFKDKLKEL